MRLKTIDKKIDNLKEEMRNVKGTECEIATRIVGYYRNLDNWNKGKREEYDHRKEFKL